MTIHLIRVNSAGEVLDGEGRPTGIVLTPKKPSVDMLKKGAEYDASEEYSDIGADVSGIYWHMLSAARPDIAALAVRVPKRREPPFMGWDSDREEYSAEGHNACLDALGIAP